jgi:antitoxin component YwqK of YwqJK toxin-antitoxin module
MLFVDDEYDGDDIEYYENGNVKSETKYQMGVLQGLAKKYYENGKITEESNYHNDLRTGEANYYNENGKLIKKELYFNGKIYESETY